ncbi:MAG: hypothetical protein SGARI_000959 [Bacillariaceae sp.]
MSSYKKARADLATALQERDRIASERAMVVGELRRKQDELAEAQRNQEHIEGLLHAANNELEDKTEKLDRKTASFETAMATLKESGERNSTLTEKYRELLEDAAAQKAVYQKQIYELEEKLLNCQIRRRAERIKMQVYHKKLHEAELDRDGIDQYDSDEESPRFEDFYDATFHRHVLEDAPLAAFDIVDNTFESTIAGATKPPTIREGLQLVYDALLESGSSNETIEFLKELGPEFRFESPDKHMDREEDFAYCVYCGVRDMFKATLESPQDALTCLDKLFKPMLAEEGGGIDGTDLENLYDQLYEKGFREEGVVLYEYGVMENGDRSNDPDLDTDSLFDSDGSLGSGRGDDGSRSGDRRNHPNLSNRDTVPAVIADDALSPATNEQNTAGAQGGDNLGTLAEGILKQELEQAREEKAVTDARVKEIEAHITIRQTPGHSGDIFHQNERLLPKYLHKFMSTDKGKTLVQWQLSGDDWVVHFVSVKEFEKHMEISEGVKSYSSYTSELKKLGFESKGGRSWYHPRFVKDDPKLAEQIRRKKSGN